MPQQENRSLEETTVPQVLVVEDDPDVRDVLTRLLRRAGYVALTATNGADAIIMAQQQQPDLILMDLMLPILSGLEATRRLKANPHTARIPVLAMTGQFLADDGAQVCSAGCAGLIHKPCSAKHFLAQVATFIGRSDTVGGTR
jgi:CheY-like chemotaxis protein